MPRNINSILNLQKKCQICEKVYLILLVIGLIFSIAFSVYMVGLTQIGAFAFLPVIFVAGYFIIVALKGKYTVADSRLHCNNSILKLSDKSGEILIDLSSEHSFECTLVQNQGLFRKNIYLYCTLKQDDKEINLRIPFSDDPRGRVSDRIHLLTEYLNELLCGVDFTDEIPIQNGTLYEIVHLNLPLFLPILDYWSSFFPKNTSVK
ncbi:MAG: hypothetical protein JXR95_08915 [Deltaproteobacteria bacterium]|nr:hypothetical protein [Deltaproteobacteria bacterium]